MWIFEREFTEREVSDKLARELLSNNGIVGSVIYRVSSQWSFATRDDGAKLPLIRITVSAQRPAEGEEYG